MGKKNRQPGTGSDWAKCRASILLSKKTGDLKKHLKLGNGVTYRLHRKGYNKDGTRRLPPKPPSPAQIAHRQAFAQAQRRRNAGAASLRGKGAYGKRLAGLAPLQNVVNLDFSPDMDIPFLPAASSMGSRKKVNRTLNLRKPINTTATSSTNQRYATIADSRNIAIKAAFKKGIFSKKTFLH